MNFLKNLFKKFKNNKGITGVDIITSVTIVVLTMGIVTAIYINTINKAKDNIRNSNAIRIATQIIENIQAKPYLELVNAGSITIDSSTEDANRRAFDVKIQKGYTVKINSSKVSTSDIWDLARNVTVEVSYKYLNRDKVVKLETIKKRELLEQVNKPFLEDFACFYGYNINYCYPIKKMTNGSYKVTSPSDPEWYNYDKGNYALVAYVQNDLNIGDSVTDLKNVFLWIPRFGISVQNTTLSKDTIQYAYGTSKYKIEYSRIGNSSNKDLYAYTLSYSGNTPKMIGAYVANTFSENDGLTGVWYKAKLVSSNAATEKTKNYETIAINAYNELKKAVECKNYSW